MERNTLTFLTSLIFLLYSYSLQSQCTADGGFLGGGPFIFCVGDEVSDNIQPGSIRLSNQEGQNFQWIVTDDLGNILGLPPMPSVVDFDGQGEGVCLVWHLSFSNGLTGLSVGQNINDFQGCYDLSNPVPVVREICCPETCSTPDIASLDGSESAMADVNASNLNFGDATISITRSFAGIAAPDENEINDSQTSGDIGIRLGVINAVGPSNYMDVDIGLSEAVCGVQFEIWDIDETDQLIIDASYNGSPVSFAVATGSCVAQLGADTFIPNGPGCEIQVRGSASHMISIYISECITDLTIRSFDQGGGIGGSYTIVLQEGCTEDVQGGTLVGGPFEFCVGDGIADNIPAGSISLSGNSGSNSAWIVTDDLNNILGVPPMPSVVNFEDVFPGECLVWFLSYEDGLSGFELGMNLDDFQGCFSLSNPISVFRNDSGDICNQLCDDLVCSVPDIASLNGSNNAQNAINNNNITVGNAVLSLSRSFNGTARADENRINNSQTSGDIGVRLGVSNAVGQSNNMEATFSLSEPVCNFSLQLWDVDQTDEIIVQAFNNGVPVSYSTSAGSCVNVAGNTLTPNGAACEVQVSGSIGHMVSIDFSDCVTDIVITSFDQGSSNNSGGSYTVVFEEGCTSLGTGMAPSGGTLTGGPFTFDSVSDGIPDMIPAGAITLSNAGGMNNQWIVTDAGGYILGLPPMPSVVDFDEPGPGTCFIYNVSYDVGLGGLAPGLNIANFTGCFGLSNPIAINRTAEGDCQANGGIIFGGPFEFDSVSDGIPDIIPAGSLTLTNTMGMTQWIVTDANGYILGLPPMPGVVDFDEPGPGTCFIYNVSYEGSIIGLGPGLNIADFLGCFSLSNPIEVARSAQGDCQANGGIIFGGPFEFDSVSDGIPDMIPAGSLTLTNTQGNTQWIVTDANGYILGLPPMPGVVDFDEPGPGTCFIYNVSYEDAIIGLGPGLNIADFDGCFSLSNPIEVARSAEGDCQANGGIIFGGPFEFDSVSDGIPDMIPAGSLTLTNTQGNSQWIVTDANGYILGLPPMPGVVDFDEPGPGTCFIYNVSYEDAIIGLGPGLNIADFEGCFSLSNPIEVARTAQGDCQANGGIIFGGPFEFDSVSDGIPDMIPAGSLTLTNTMGMTQWIVTDANGYILGLPPMPGVVDFDEPGPGTCFIYNVSYEDAIIGLGPGLNIADFEGCFSLSNPIEVARSAEGDCQANGGIIFGGPFEFDSVSDGIPDMIPAGSLTLTNTMGMTQWIVTDANGYILGLPPMPGVVDFDEPGPGTCFIYNVSYEGGITGLAPGLNIADFTGCFSLSNPIEVARTAEGDCQANGGILFGGPFEFDSVSDGIPDMIPAGSITLANAQGNMQWIVTDDQGNILGLPPMPAVVDFDIAGPGTCFIYNVSYEGVITGLDVGANIADFGGDCFSLSNRIAVNRSSQGGCQANGGELIGGPFEFNSVSDGIPDMIPAGSITLANTVGVTQWIVTDANGYILGLPPMPGVVDFDEPGPGTCFIYNVSYQGAITGLGPGLNIADFAGCFSLSNPIEVARSAQGDCQANGGIIFGGPFEFDSVSDGTPDMIPAGSLTLTNTQGNTQWIVTDANGYILGLPPMPGVVDFDEPGPGTCFIYNVSYEDAIIGLGPGLNIADFAGCFSLSNPIEVARSAEGDCQANGGIIFGGPFEFDSVSDGIPDMIPAGSLTLTNTMGMTQWIVTDANGYILGLPPMPGVVDFDEPGPGTCFIYNVSYEGGITGLAPGLNIADFEGCFSLSNPIEVARSAEGDCQANGGIIFGGPFEFDSVSDGIPDMIPAGSLTLTNTMGMTQWIVTDANGYILGLPPMPGVVDFDEPGPGTCFIYNVSYEGGITGLAPGLNIADFDGCFSLSNPIEVARTARGDCQANGGIIFGGPFEFDSVSDGIPDMIPTGSITLANAQGNMQWIVTDDQGNILGLPPMPSVVDFDVAGTGTCFIYNVSYEGSITGLSVGANIADFGDCFSLSNPIPVNRSAQGDCQVNGGELMGGPFDFCVGDGVADFIPMGSIGLSNNNGPNTAWVVTDQLGNILGVPPSPSVVNFDVAGLGICLVWHLSFEDGFTGLDLGMNIDGFDGCYDLSNPVYVFRNDSGAACDPNCGVFGGVLGGGPFEFCVGDDEADFIPAGAISLNGSFGPNNRWIVTDDLGNILGLPPMPSVVDFDGQGVGVCLIWNVNFVTGLQGLTVGQNLIDFQGCYSLSNPISVIREDCNVDDDCLFSLDIDDVPIVAGLYSVFDNITSSGIVANGDVEFTANNFIELQVGFEVTAGNEFHAFIEGCDDFINTAKEAIER